MAISQVLLRGGSTYRDMLKGEEARREDLDIDIEVKFNRICDEREMILSHETYERVDMILKGHCHAIWQLFKKLEGVFSSIEFQN